MKDFGNIKKFGHLKTEQNLSSRHVKRGFLPGRCKYDFQFKQIKTPELVFFQQPGSRKRFFRSLVQPTQVAFSCAFSFAFTFYAYLYLFLYFPKKQNVIIVANNSEKTMEYQTP